MTFVTTALTSPGTERDDGLFPTCRAAFFGPRYSLSSEAWGNQPDKACWHKKSETLLCSSVSKRTIARGELQHPFGTSPLGFLSRILRGRGQILRLTRIRFVSPDSMKAEEHLAIPAKRPYFRPKEALNIALGVKLAGQCVIVTGGELPGVESYGQITPNRTKPYIDLSSPRRPCRLLPP